MRTSVQRDICRCSFLQQFLAGQDYQVYCKPIVILFTYTSEQDKRIRSHYICQKEAKQLALVKSLKEMQSTCMITIVSLLKLTVDVECLIFFSTQHGTHNYSVFSAPAHGLFRFYKTKQITGFSLYITRKIKTNYTVHREDTT